MNENQAFLNGLTLELNHNDFTASVIDSNDLTPNILIPRSIIYQLHEYLITKVAPNAFQNNRKLKSVSFAENSVVKSIGKSAFSGSSIEKLTIPSSLEKLEKGWCKNAEKLIHIYIEPKNDNYIFLETKVIIGKSDANSNNFDTLIFALRNVEKVSIPTFIKYISSHSFSGCKKLKAIEFSEDSKLLRISNNAFSLSSISQIFIPKSVEELKDGWCKYTSMLTSVILSEENANFEYLDFERNMIVDRTGVLNFASRCIVEAFIPSSVKRIGSGAFSECKFLKRIEIANDSNLISIGKNAFFRTSISSFCIPSKVKFIEDSAFMNCSQMSSFIFDEDSQLEIIGDNAFSCSSITEITIPSHVKRIGSFSLSDCELLQSVKFQENSELQTIGDHAFAFSPIKSFILPPCVNKIEEYAFTKCREISTVDFSQNTELKTIGNGIFAMSYIKSISIPKNIIEIEDSAFLQCRYLREIYIPEDSELRIIGENAFHGTYIDHLFFPENMEEVRNNWCCYTTNLLAFSIAEGNKNFKFLDDDEEIIVGKSDPNEDIFDVIVFVVRDILSIFIDCYIKYIGSSALSACYDLSSVCFAEISELVSVGENAFSGSFIEFICFPESLKDVGAQAFARCTDLLSIEFLGNELNLGRYCFSGCDNLNIISFPNASKISLFGKDLTILNDNCVLYALPCVEIVFLDI